MVNPFNFLRVRAEFSISLCTENGMLNVECLSIPSRYGSTRSIKCTLWNCRQLLAKGKSHKRNRKQFKNLVLGNFQRIGAHFGHFQPHFSQVKYKWEPATGPQSCPKTNKKKLDKCSNDKLCVMTAPSIARYSFLQWCLCDQWHFVQTK